MDYEKMYKEALERAKANYKADKEMGFLENCDMLELIFPQLAESKDERVIKIIINCLQHDESLSHQDVDDCITYLEKQKESLPIPNKFSGLKSLMLQYLQSAANRKDDTEIESDTDLWGRKILDYVWKYSDEQKEQKSVEFTHHEIDESLKDAVTHQMEDDGDVDDYVRRGIDDIALKYAELGAKWQKEQKEPHYTKRNALFDKCVENCDPKVMKEVSDKVDEMLQKEQKPAESRKRNRPKESWLSEAKYEIEHADELLMQRQEELRKIRELKKQEQHPSSRFLPCDWVVYDGPLGHAILQVKDVVGGRYSFVDNDSTLLVEDSDKFLRPLTPEDVEKPAEWKPQPESLEALMYAIEGKWDAISPTSYLSRRLEDLYEGLVNTYNVDESLLAELPKAASRAYTAEGIEELRELKRKIEASMELK